jgi:UPF0042 nucleotide-binding protein
VVVSGLSGAGKTIVLHALEDLGYYCIDNLPANLLPAFAAQMVRPEGPDYDSAAVGIDARNPARSLQSFPAIFRDLRQQGVRCELLFLEADEASLIKRFSETRRKHPLTSATVPLADAIRRERELLEPLSSAADIRIDTSHTTMHQLRDMVRERLDRRPERRLSLLFESFGFKRGVPGDADYVFDLRFLPNPHWDPRLRPLTGHHAEVAEFLAAEPMVEEMFQALRDFLERWLPRFEAENRAYLTVAMGCTGGQHRSVYMAERLAAHFRARGQQVVLVRHRELT